MRIMADLLLIVQTPVDLGGGGRGLRNSAREQAR